MNERTRILNMVAEGKITAEDAEKLLDALETKAAYERDKVEFKDKRGRKGKKFRVNIDAGEGGGGTKFNVGIPISMVRAFGPMVMKNLPKETREEMDRCGVNLMQVLEDLEKATEEASDEDVVNIGTDGDDPTKINVYID